MDNKNLYQWGVETYTINNPAIETLQHYLARKGAPNAPWNEVGARTHLIEYVNTKSPNLRWFIGTQEEFEKYRKDAPILEKADKGLLTNIMATWHTIFFDTINKIIRKLDTSHGHALTLREEMVAKYNLDLAIKDLDPTHQIPYQEKGFIPELLAEIKKYNIEIYNRLLKVIDLDGEALHDEIMDRYKAVVDIIHPKVSDQQIVDSVVSGGIT